jgi:cytosine/adenosine deaminase-related metal-dependent hydrolase
MASQRLLIRNGYVVSLDPEIGDLPRGDILVEGSTIAAVGPDLQAGDCEVIDATDCIVIPGFVDTHRHTWQAPLRNIAADWSLFHYLAGLHFGLSGHFRPEDTYAGNLLGAVEAVDAGITTLLDWSHNLKTPQHADAAVAGLRDAGGRAIFAHGGGADEWQVVPPNELPHPADARRVREEHFSSEDGLLTMALAIRGPQFTTRDVARHDWELANDLGLRITVHVGDGEFGKTGPISWLASEGLLNDRTTYVHCNTLTDDELRLIADSGGTASVAADVEMQMGHGWPATGRLLEVGVRPSLSIDVCSSIGGSMFSLMRTVLGTQRALDNAAADAAGIPAGSEAPRVSCRDVLEFATIEGARACGLEDRVGSLTPGKQADIVILRADNVAMRPLNNAVGALVYNAHIGLVDTVLVAGRAVKRDGALLDDAGARARRLAEATRDHLLDEALKDPKISDIALGGTWFPEMEPAA